MKVLAKNNFSDTKKISAKNVAKKMLPKKIKQSRATLGANKLFRVVESLNLNQGSTKMVKSFIALLMIFFPTDVC